MIFNRCAPVLGWSVPVRILVAVLLSLVSSFAVTAYDVHITRKAFWAEESEPRFTFAE
jgi:hypothetical protein